MIATLLLVVYLFLINYGRSKPDDTAHAISSFLTDSEDRNPLIRALALRTMTSIPLPSMISAVLDPLRHGLKDADPYVRKTAALSYVSIIPFLEVHPIQVRRDRFTYVLSLDLFLLALPNSIRPHPVDKRWSVRRSSLFSEISSPTRTPLSLPTPLQLSSRSQKRVTRSL
jgi:hypothetical protein